MIELSREYTYDFVQADGKTIKKRGKEVRSDSTAQNVYGY